MLFLILCSLSPLALAHGPIAEQASHAVDSATEVFLKSQPKDVQRRFYSVLATLAGHEKFEVFVTLNDKTTTFKYECTENELVDPVVWECQAR